MAIYTHTLSNFNVGTLGMNYSMGMVPIAPLTSCAMASCPKRGIIAKSCQPLQASQASLGVRVRKALGEKCGAVLIVKLIIKSPPFMSCVSVFVRVHCAG